MGHVWLALTTNDCFCFNFPNLNLSCYITAQGLCSAWTCYCSVSGAMSRFLHRIQSNVTTFRCFMWFIPIMFLLLICTLQLDFLFCGGLAHLQLINFWMWSAVAPKLLAISVDCDLHLVRFQCSLHHFHWDLPLMWTISFPKFRFLKKVTNLHGLEY